MTRDGAVYGHLSSDGGSRASGQLATMGNRSQPAQTSQTSPVRQAAFAQPSLSGQRQTNQLQQATHTTPIGPQAIQPHPQVGPFPAAPYTFGQRPVAVGRATAYGDSRNGEGIGPAGDVPSPTLLPAADCPGCRNCSPSANGHNGHNGYGGSGSAARWRLGPGGPIVMMDEVLCDGGDRDVSAIRAANGRIFNVDMEDTVGFYETETGQREVAASNRVCIYAPRFGSTRKVTGFLSHKTHTRGAGFELNTPWLQHKETQLATTSMQASQAITSIGELAPHGLSRRIREMTFDNVVQLRAARSALEPYEHFTIISSGVFDNSEKLRLATSLQNAMEWTSKQAVQVVIDGEPAIEMHNISKPQAVARYELPDGKSRLRIVKVASRDNAHPGDKIEFTLRFDNIGDQELSKVAIVDNLVTRLEYVEDSASCSVDAEFATEINDGDSLQLIWKLKEPLATGKGGVIKFQCLVR
jgi:uncharacterized repeat protein (TIGR01451 family)